MISPCPGVRPIADLIMRWEWEGGTVLPEYEADEDAPVERSRSEPQQRSPLDPSALSTSVPSCQHP